MTRREKKRGAKWSRTAADPEQRRAELWLVAQRRNLSARRRRRAGLHRAQASGRQGEARTRKKAADPSSVTYEL
jgi:hypothetical protein